MTNINNDNYREEMQAQIAYDIWFMNTHLKNEWDENFSWSENCFPIEANDGWLYPLYVLCTKLLTEVKSNFQVIQIKEKYGTARFYYSGGITKYGQEIIEQFEKDSAEICELCGKPAKIRNIGGWYVTYCDECWKENKNER